jgi:hypothetical protein
MLRESRRISTLALCSALALGCSAKGSANNDSAPNLDDESIPQVPVPAANGPKLVALKHNVIVRDRPSPNGKVVGVLRAGGRVSRAAEPYSKRNCAGGWYPIRPRGFVCAGDEASTDLENPVARLLAEEPSLDRALPYRYGRVKKGESVLYAKLPTPEEQLAAEPKLADGREKEKEPKRLGTGANDVPLGETFLPNGVPVIQSDGDGVGPDGYRTTASIFTFPGTEALPSHLTVGGSLGLVDNRIVKTKSGVAVVGTFLVGEGPTERRFGLTPEGRFVPIDRLGEALGTTWHGVDFAEGTLPVAFAIRNPHTWSIGKGDHPEMLDEEFESKEAVRLSGRFRTVDGTLFYATADDKRWVRHKDFVMVLPRHKFPDFADTTTKWIDISLANQTLIAWEGHRPIYATLISSGQDRLGDPSAGAPATLQGQFRVRSKVVSRTLDDAEVKGEYSVSEAPWVLEFADGFAITGSYWQSAFGEPQNFHNVTVSPVDAHWLWHWTDIELPEGWHGVTLGEDAPSPIVYVHK